MGHVPQLENGKYQFIKYIITQQNKIIIIVVAAAAAVVVKFGIRKR